MNRHRRSFIWMAVLFASVAAAKAHAHYGGRPRDRGDTGARRPARPGDDNLRGAAPPLVDPLAAVERELPSLRIDLKLNGDLAPLFDSFERQVRNAADAGRMRARHLSAFRAGDTSSVTADAALIVAARQRRPT